MNNASPETRQQRRYRQRVEKKGPPRPQKNAFNRALDTFKQRAEALKAASLIGPLEAKLALMDLANKLGQYKSRGHGRGTPARNHLRIRSRYRPHQGAQETFRRRLGGYAATMRAFGQTKRQMLGGATR